MKAVEAYLTKWQGMGYPCGIPDECPEELMQLNLAPSYKQIALCLLQNDMQMLKAGGTAKESKWYGVLKQIEIQARPKKASEQLYLF